MAGQMNEAHSDDSEPDYAALNRRETSDISTVSHDMPLVSRLPGTGLAAGANDELGDTHNDFPECKLTY